jgi:hypothetical protein
MVEGFVRQALLGSVTLRVLKEAASDVLVAKPYRPHDSNKRAGGH